MGSFFGEKHQCFYCANRTQLVCTQCRDICCAECRTESGLCPMCIRVHLFHAERRVCRFLGADISIQRYQPIADPYLSVDWFFGIHDQPTESDLPTGFTTVLAEV